MSDSSKAHSDSDQAKNNPNININRRRVLKGLGAAGVVGATAGKVGGQEGRPGVWNHVAANVSVQNNDVIPTSCQFWSFNEAELDTVELIYEAGEYEYDAVEPFGGPDNLGDPDEVLEALDDTGLELGSTHIDMEEVEDDPEGVAEVYQQFGEVALIEPYVNDDTWVTEESVIEFAERCNTLADEMAEYDLEFGYHNHDHEFAEIEDGDQIAYDIFAEEVEDHVHLQIDAGWVLTGGEDPIHYIINYADEVSSIHMKNMTDGDFVEVDEGDVGMRGVATAARNAAEVDYLVYEYDDAPEPFESMEIGSHWMNRLNHPWEPGGICAIRDADTHPAKLHEPDEEAIEEIEEEEAAGDIIEPGTAIEFEGDTGGWIGLSPEEIEGEENPTLTLAEGESYEIGWTEGDGAGHNVAVYDDDGEVVDDLSTSVVADPGDDQWLEFEASDEMAQYVCEPHLGTMVGNIEMQDDEEVEEDDEEDVSVEEQPDDAAATFVTPEDGDTVESPVEIEAEVEAIELVEAGEPVVGEGHLHVLVDNDPFEEGETIPGPGDEAEDDGLYHWGDGASGGELDLDPGEYDLILQIADGPHRAFGEYDEIQITVED